MTVRRGALAIMLMINVGIMMRLCNSRKSRSCSTSSSDGNSGSRKGIIAVLACSVLSRSIVALEAETALPKKVQRRLRSSFCQ